MKSLKSSVMTCTLLAISVAFAYDDVAWKFEYSGRPADSRSVWAPESALQIAARSVWCESSQVEADVLARSVFRKMGDWTVVSCLSPGFLMFLK